MKRIKSGFTLVEVVAVIVIIAILIPITIFFGTKLEDNARIDSVETELRVMHSDCDRMLSDNGIISYAPNLATAQANQATDWTWLNDFATNYCKFTLDKSTFTVTPTYIEVQTKSILDAYSKPYLIIVNTDNTSARPGTVIIASAGPNNKFATSSYSAGKFSDDILVVIAPK